MCQLLGMNGNVPTDICFSFEGFRARGGKTDEHVDGWGIAFFEGPGCRVFLDDQASSGSTVAELVRNYPIRSTNVIAHIRKASHGKVSLENTHPFQRELWGRYWIFAHNGELENFNPSLSNIYRPVGETDSERAFCQILEHLKARFPGKDVPSTQQLTAALKDISEKISPHGIFNFLLSNGELLFARSSTDLHYIVRKAPFAEAHLVDEDISINFSDVTTPSDRVAIIATKPLTDNETWTRIAPDTLMVFVDGEPVD
ncbi:MAG: class II glutamine amidotransferase [Ectothiorhodospiraceae bacterium]|nr:class II glutamine amidotransferase [Ectothiorhodospiraceae bacterium]